MKNRKLLLIVSVVLAMTMSLGGTLAYLTDTDADVNTMVLGNVQITQNEQERVKDAEGKFTTELQGFTNNQQIYPAVFETGNDPANDKTVQVGDYKLNVYGMKTWPNYVDKIVTVTNNGNSDAYVRTLIAVPVVDNTDGSNVSEQWLHYNPITDTDTTPNNGWSAGKALNDSEWNTATNNYVKSVVINSKTYEVYVATNKNVIEPNETTGPCLAGFYIDNDVDYKNGSFVDAAGNSVWSADKIDILVISQAVQAKGFTDAYTALNAGFGEINSTNVTKWFNELYKDGAVDPDKIDTPSDEWPSNNPVDPDVTVVKSINELQTALSENKPFIMFGTDITGDVTVTQKAGVNLVIDGASYKYNGKMTVDGDGRHTGTETLTIKNIDFVAKAGADSCIYSPDRGDSTPPKYSYSHNVTVENCTFTDPDGTVNCAAIRHGDGGDNNWTVKNCTVDSTMHSLLQINNVNGKLTIEDCKVYSKNGANLNSTTNLEMNKCTFDVRGYAVRFGVNSGGDSNATKTFVINDSTLKSACDDGDAVIIFRISAANSNTTLTLNNTQLFGTTQYSGDENINKN